MASRRLSLSDSGVRSIDRDASDDDRRAALDQPPPGVLWLCGLETVMRQDDGRLDASIVGAPIFPEPVRAGI